MSPATYSPLQFGAVGDGIADDSDALNAMRDQIISDQAASLSTTFTMYFPAGKSFMYTKNHWTWGIRNLQLIGNGCTFQNTASFATLGSEAAYALHLNRSCFELQGPDDAMSIATNSQISLIDNASSGASSVNLATPVEAANFPVGERVVVYSYEQLLSGGYPPDPRYVDYAKVTAANASTGVISIDTPLAHSHRSDCPEITGAICGRARIMALDTFASTLWGDTLYMENMTFLDNPNAGRPGDGPGPDDPLFRSHQYVLVSGFQTAYLRNIVGSSLVPSCISKATFDTCNFFGTTPDKFINDLLYTNCTLGPNAISESTGVDLLDFESGTISMTTGSIMGYPRQLTFNNSTINQSGVDDDFPPSINLNETFQLSLTVTNCVFNGGGGTSIPIGAAGKATLPVDGTIVSVASNVLTMDPTNATVQTFLRLAQNGLSVGYLPSGSTTEQAATITSVSSSGAGELVTVVISVSATIAIGDSIVAHMLRAASQTGNTFDNYGGPPNLTP